MIKGLIQISKTGSVTILFFILDPPGAPNITGLSSETVLIEDQVRRITCISMAGNPLADLKWYRGDEELTNSVTIKGEDDQYSKSELTITVNRCSIEKYVFCNTL